MLQRPTLASTVLALATGLASPAAQAVTVESRVAASADDAEEYAAGNVSIVGSDLELGWDGSPQTLGLRFPALAVPQGATVLSAWVQFETDEATATSVALTFHAQASDNAPSFTTSDEDLTTRPRAPVNVAWTPAPWTTVGQAGPAQRTPDLASLVQAVVDRPGWAEGNALVLLVEGDGGNGRRIARAWNSDPTGAPLLHVEYDVIPVNDPPALSLVAPLPGAQLPADEPVSLVATATDPEQGNLGAAVRWSSSRDGFLGTGASLARSLSVGLHTLTAEVRDAEGLTASASVEVQVTPSGHVLLVAGDIANCNSQGDEATAALLDERAGLVVTLGDNAYPDGTLGDFQDCYEPSWGRHKARTRPATGNHEYHVDGAAGHFAYYGAAAGDPDDGWYSFDLGSWHIVVLNSNCSQIGGCGRSSRQGLWFEADLAANPRDCTIAVTHHPRFSSGISHGSIGAMRDLYAVFHEHGGDLFLSGHDHHYERFGPQNALGVADLTGPRQFVVGTGGGSQREVGPLEPHSLASAGNLYGILALTLRQTSYDWEFVPAAGSSYTDSGSTSCVSDDEEPVNERPHVVITAPRGNSRFWSGDPVSFVGEASDAEDGSLTGAIIWSSNRDGDLGTGPSVTTSALSTGWHVIFARVEDSGALPAAATVNIEVRQPITVTVEKRIGASSDDAEEGASGPRIVSLGSLDLELIDDGADQDTVGLRFAALDIPRGARILAAWLQFQADGSTSTATSLSIRAEASDDAPTFFRIDGNVSGRARGEASVSWNPPPWVAGQQGEAQRSPSLVSVVQEVVDRDGWAPGNDLVLVLDGTGLRRAESWDGMMAAAPLLHVEYQDEVSSGGGGGGTVGCGIGPELGPVLALAILHRLRRRAQARSSARLR